MKPRISLRFGVWGCWGVKAKGFVRAGFGWTPKEAYDDWLKEPD